MIIKRLFQTDVVAGLLTVPQRSTKGLPAAGHRRGQETCAERFRIDCRRPARRAFERGQALVELLGVVLMCTILVFAVIDFGRFIYERQILVNVTREGANLISRGTTITNALNAVIGSAVPLTMSTRGRVIMSTVINSNGVPRVSSQLAQGSLVAASKIGAVNAVATLPTANVTVTIPQPSQILYVSEAYYTFTPITPIGRLLAMTLPTQIYDVAFF